MAKQGQRSGPALQPSQSQEERGQAEARETKPGRQPETLLGQLQ